MKKEIVLEISRIHDIMGIESKKILKESTGCPLCDIMNSKIDDLARKFANKEIDYTRFQYEVDELIRRIELDGSTQKLLSVGELSALSQIRKNLDNLKATSNSVDSYKIAVKNAINNSNSLSDRTLQGAKNIKTKIIDVIDWDTISKTPEYADYVFKNSSEITDTLITFGGNWLSKTADDIKAHVDTYKTIDVYAENVKKAMKDHFLEVGLEESLAESLSNMFKKWTKENTNISKHFPNVAPVIDNKTSNTIKRPRKVGMGDETLDPTYTKRYYELINKNGSELTDDEIAFLKGVEDWKSGKEVDFENLKINNLDEENLVIESPSPDPDVNPDTVAESTSYEVADLFNRSRDEVNIQELNDVQKLREYSANNRPKPTDPDSIIIDDVKNAITKGKKLSKYTDEQIETAFKNKGFTDVEISTYKKRLQTPVKGYGAMDFFYWNTIEPMFKRWSAMLSDIIKTKAFTKIPTTQDLINDFMPDIERVLNNFDPSKNYQAAIKEMRIKFGKIRSSDPATYGSYKLLFNEWDYYMQRNLSGQSLDNWYTFRGKLLKQEEGLFGSSWKRMIDGPLEGAVSKDGMTMEQFFQKFKRDPVTTTFNTITKSFYKMVRIDQWLPYLLKKGLTFFFTNVFTSPKAMEEFFIDNGYALTKTKFGPNNLLGLPNASIANFIKPQLYKWVLIPTAAVIAYSFYEALGWLVTGTDIAEMDKADVYRKFMIDWGWGKSDSAFLSEKQLQQLPNWYQEIAKYGFLGEFTAPVLEVGIWGTAFYQSKAEGKVLSGSEEFRKQKEEMYINTMNEYDKDAKNSYEKMDVYKQNEIKINSYYSTLKYQLERGGIKYLTKDDSKLLLDNLSFEPGAPLTVRSKIAQEVGSITEDDIKNMTIKKLSLKNINKENGAIKLPENLTVVGNVLLKGKSGAKYLVVPVVNSNDPEGIYNSTSDPLIKDGYAWIKPQYTKLIPNEDKIYFNLKQFVNNYENL